MNRMHRRLETIANGLIILVAVVTISLFVRQYVVERKTPSLQKPAVGSRLMIEGINWAENGKTVILTLSSRCRFCALSAPFYRHLVEISRETGAMKIVAIFPHSVEEGQTFLSSLGVEVDDIRTVDLSIVGASATPTLILVNDKGIIVDSRVGMLSPETEAEILANF